MYRILQIVLLLGLILLSCAQRIRAYIKIGEVLEENKEHDDKALDKSPEPGNQYDLWLAGVILRRSGLIMYEPDSINFSVDTRSRLWQVHPQLRLIAVPDYTFSPDTNTPRSN